MTVNTNGQGHRQLYWEWVWLNYLSETTDLLSPTQPAFDTEDTGVAEVTWSIRGIFTETIAKVLSVALRSCETWTRRFGSTNTAPRFASKMSPTRSSSCASATHALFQWVIKNTWKKIYKTTVIRSYWINSCTI